MVVTGLRVPGNRETAAGTEPGLQTV